MKLPANHVAGEGVVKASGYGGLGERLLRSMGWQDGKGLGKEGQGMKEALQVKKKEDTQGVGANPRYNWDDKWWERAFDSAAQTVGSASDSASSGSESEEEGGPHRHVGGKNRDGTATTASRDELKLLKALSKGGRLAAGRFGGRDAKMERIREQEAKQAAEAAEKLGISSAQGGASDRSDTTSEAQLPSTSKKRSLSEDVETAGKKEKQRKKEKKERDSKKQAGVDGKGSAAAAVEEEAADQPPAARNTRIIIEPTGSAPPPAWNFTATPTEGWWGAAMFVSAGCLDGMRKDLAQPKREEFTEDAQEKLYTTAHATKRAGKIGLGQGTGTVKVGGVKWSGRKVTFGEERGAGPEGESGGEGGEDEEEEGAGALRAVGSSTGLVKLDSSWAESVRWKKLVAKALEGRSLKKGMKLTALAAAVMPAVVEKVGVKAGGVTEADVLTQVQCAVTASSKFLVEGKRVRLKV